LFDGIFAMCDDFVMLFVVVDASSINVHELKGGESCDGNIVG
jgi:hypothetical protein